MLGRKPELAVAGWKDRVWDWGLEDKTDARSGEDLLVAAIADDFFFFREDITARACLSTVDAFFVLRIIC